MKVRNDKLIKIPHNKKHELTEDEKNYVEAEQSAITIIVLEAYQTILNMCVENRLNYIQYANHEEVQTIAEITISKFKDAWLEVHAKSNYKIRIVKDIKPGQTEH